MTNFEGDEFELEETVIFQYIDAIKIICSQFSQYGFHSCHA